jgi:small subunit ribosomal protein S8
MAMSDPIGDLLTRIRNGQHARKQSITAPASQLKAGVLEVLKNEGFIRGYSERDVRQGVKELVIELKYYEGEPVIREIGRISTPGRRVYSGFEDLDRERGGLGIRILSTPRGVMSDTQARETRVGGEVLCRVF